MPLFPNSCILPEHKFLHAVFCCVGALAITGSLHHIDRDLLGWWLCERQCKDGGLNGRPEKLADVCYSWWVLSSLIMIDRVHWIDKEKLTKFILNCQVTVYYSHHCYLDNHTSLDS